jgi:threonine synthase
MDGVVERIADGKPAAPGIWRWASALPETAGHRVTLGEGDTPLVPLPRLGARIGLPDLWAKLEQTNPTGSYKDRIAACSLSLALARGDRGWIATSSGNASTSLVAYGARAGLPGMLLVTPNIPREKLIPSLSGRAHVVKVAGTGTGGSPEAASRTFETARAAAAAHRLFLGITAHAYNPDGMRGADTIGHELAAAGIAADACYVPTGGGGLATAIGRGLAAAGSAEAVVIAQPSGCAPIARVLAGELEEVRVDRCDTAISGLQLPLPPDGDAAIAAARASGGWGVAVDDEAILDAQLLLSREEGLLVEPASATALAGVVADRRSGRLDGGARVVLVLTGSGMKDLATPEARLAAPATCEPAQLDGEIAAWLDAAAPAREAAA